MDHLSAILPPGAAAPAITVLYKAPKEKYYDGQGFFDYPARQGWSESDLIGEDNFGHRSKEDIEIFFQSWLYFGTVIEVFKAVGIVVTTDDFVNPSTSPSSQTPVVTTAKLPAFLAQWKSLWPLPQGVSPDCSCKSYIEPLKVNCKAKPCWKDLGPALLSPAWDTVRQIIDRVCYFLDRNCTISRKLQIKGRAPPAACPWPVSDEVATSIIALGSTLRQAAITYWEIPRLGDQWTAGSSRILKAALQEKYCASDVALMMEDLPIDGHYYLAAGEGRGLAYLDAHSECSEARCVAKMDEKTYVTLHAPGCVDSTCRVSFAGPSSTAFIESVVKVIDNGGTPIIHWDQNRKCLAVDEYNPNRGLEPRYVAISHVWADGMGNPTQNRLPDCQLSRIQDMINALDIPEHNTDTETETRVGFWMDTLCIPVGTAHKQQKKASIRRMRHIYKQASAVLVLDAWMQSIQPSSTPIERCARLYSSNWIRRLWTLQEGTLNRNVFFQWEGKAETSEALANARVAWENDAQGRGTVVSFPIIAASKVSLYFLVVMDIVDMIANGEAPPEMRAHLFLPLCDALGPRATTRVSDETLCLSTVLGLDPKTFLDIENNDGDEEDVVQRRMESFLRNLGEFNAALIFNSYHKLQRDGVRWAPRSLLRHRTADLGPVFLSEQTGRMETVGRFSGLAVRFPGFLIRGNPRLGSSRGVTVSLAESDKADVQVAVCEGEITTDIGNADAQYAVIWPGDLQQLGPEGCRGLIGQVQPGKKHKIDGEDITVVRYLCGVMITRTERKPNLQPEVVTVREQASRWLV
ncbi:hypothetical protein BDW68DRAFT_153686, partial [Aspergillus falconensis]